MLLLLLIEVVVVLAVFSAVGRRARGLRRGDRSGAAALPQKPCL
jgi:hypothetical protein